MATLKPEEHGTPNISRRQFMETASMAALGTALNSVTAEAKNPPSGPPNILLIISDEHNASVTGCYGNDTILTPESGPTGLARCGIRELLHELSALRAVAAFHHFGEILQPGGRLEQRLLAS